MSLRVMFGLLILVVLGLFASTAGADPFVGPPICSSAGTALSGTHGPMTVTGNAYVPAGHVLIVRGNLTLAPASCLDAFTLGEVHVSGNVLVGAGAVLALGCTPNAIGPEPPCGETTTHDTVDGSIVADRPLTMYLDGDTVHGSVISHGGGPGLEGPFVNFPIKDNKIDGNLTVEGWKGGWAGLIRNSVLGNVGFSHNMSVQDPDSNEVMTNVINGNLACFGNSPSAQVNPADGGQPNIVAGQKLGQCEHL